MKLIDKDALVAEIEKRIADNKKDIECASHKNLEDYFEGYEDALVLLKEKFLDTLEVKEVDFEKENNVIGTLEREVKIDAGGYPYIDCDIEFYDYDKDIPLAKEGDKVKVVLVKGE